MPPAPIINANNSNIAVLRGWRSMALQLSQDRVVARRHAQPTHQVLTRTAAHAVADQAHDLSHPYCSARMGQSNLGQTVCEGSSPAFPVPALPSVQREFDFHHLALNRQILEATVVPAMPVSASHPAIRADTKRLCSGGNNPIFFIAKRDTQYSNPWARRPFRFRSHSRR